MDLKEEDILGSRIHEHWYYISKGRALRQFLGNIRVSEVLDVGAGSGIFSRQLMEAGVCESAVCVDPNYPEERMESVGGKQIRFVKGVKNVPQKLVLMMDVLEHVPDDLALLSDYTAGMDTDAYVLITVPAFQFMWSGHDVFLEHYRRYTIDEIETVVKRAGMTPVRSRYFFGSLFPAIAALRLVRKVLLDRGSLEPHSDLKVYPDWANSTLIALHDMERHSLFGINKLFGLSVFCLCRKVQPPAAIA
jgi:hypothetical protein